MNIIMLGPPIRRTQGRYIECLAWFIIYGDLFREILKQPEHPLYRDVRY